MLQTSQFNVQAPWNGVGVKSGANDVEQAMKDARLDFDVEVTDSFHRLDDGSFVNAGDDKFIRRTDTKQILGRCGKVWRPLQNRDAFKFFQPFLDKQLARIDTVGSLNGGRKVWILAELNREPSTIVKGDQVAKFILLMNGHDGGTSIRGGFTPFRLSCANQMPMLNESIARGASQIIRIRHSGDVRQT